MKKLLILLLLLLCTIYAENNQLIILHNGSTSTIQTENTEAVNNNQDNSFTEPVFESGPKKKYTDEKTKCTLEFPMSWKLDTSSENYSLIASPYNDNRIVFTLKAYEAPEEITANTVFLFRAGEIWDRWQMLVSKTYNPKECFLVGVNEKISAVYKRQEINEQFTLLATIGAEDIYVKAPNLVYILTVQAPEAVMKKYNQTVKNILYSFYVSEDTNGKKL